MISFNIYEDEAGTRLDVVVVAHVPELSRAYVKSLIEDGKVLLNGKPVKAGEKVRTGERIAIDFDRAQLDKIPNIQLPIIYEDDDVTVLNKPVGVLTHSKGSFNPEATIATFIQPHVVGLSGERAGIVHRLDRATSGVIITAKHPEALKWLQKQFSTRKAKKTYIAIVEGEPSPAEAIIDMPIERNPKKPQAFRVGVGGKPATTAYKVLEHTKQFSLVELKPTTGRTHQLRVHLSYIGHPIVGDTLYKGHEADRLYLHALRLELTLPSREGQVFEAPLPKQFKEFMTHHG